ncbi:MAG: hypothetical protein JO320_17785 [Alphaproteobacteria bacterium]|nr:hypothetical protein [Alphaproteobacteria bacterium]MBV9376877.1 hypothetical protein [Alphaproteobacteria bacterium]MBV9815417.1 hypothetical protein [Alphaproteobacteria bacterium]
MTQFFTLTEGVAGKGAGAWTIIMRQLAYAKPATTLFPRALAIPIKRPPEMLIEATVCASREHRTGYSATIGYPALGQAIAARQARRTGQPCTAENVPVVPPPDG